MVVNPFVGKDGECHRSKETLRRDIDTGRLGAVGEVSGAGEPQPDAGENSESDDLDHRHCALNALDSPIASDVHSEGHSEQRHA
ncbi:MAG: hypothetical protein M5U19_07155 [Microthrixaceae bacterium]|nr:hypothetical protein [Microthrixaceae bacterium]